MPICDHYKGLGYSDYTPTKNSHLSEIVNTHARIIKAIKKRHNNTNPYLYIDFTSGPGIYLNGTKGSPVIVIDILRQLELSYEARLYEICSDSAASLMSIYADDPNVGVYNMDHSDIPNVNDGIGQYKWWYGLAYIDPTGSIPDFKILKWINTHYPQLDILINMSSTNLKRIRKAFHKEPSLNVLLSYTGKEYWIIREPFGRHQWSMMLGTNWHAHPAFEKIGMHKVDSIIGQETLNKLSLTKEELDCVQSVANY